MRSWLRGNYTVEAAFVVPVLLGMAFVIWYVVFLFHDRVILQDNFRYAACLLTEGEMVCQREIYQPILEEKLWITRIKQAEIKERAGMVCGKISAESCIKIPVLNLFMDKWQQINLKENCSGVHPEMFRGWGGKKDVKERG